MPSRIPETILRRYGWLPDRPDHRDLKFSMVRPSLIDIPKSVDLRPYCSPVENQGSTSSCTANALAGNIELLEVKNGKPLENVSRLFIYYNARAMEHSTLFDAGSFIRDGIKSLVEYGVCSENLWDFDPIKIRLKPSRKAYKDARNHQITSYYRIEMWNLEDMLKCLAEGFPFVFGFAVYPYFESAEMAKTGILPMPEKDGKMLGGHAVMAVGYDLEKKMFLIRNSWGAEWGQGGYFWMPFDYVTNTELTDDFWTIRQAENY